MKHDKSYLHLLFSRYEHELVAWRERLTKHESWKCFTIGTASLSLWDPFLSLIPLLIYVCYMGTVEVSPMMAQMNAWRRGAPVERSLAAMADARFHNLRELKRSMFFNVCFLYMGLAAVAPGYVHCLSVGLNG